MKKTTITVHGSIWCRLGWERAKVDLVTQIERSPRPFKELTFQPPGIKKRRSYDDATSYAGSRAVDRALQELRREGLVLFNLHTRKWCVTGQAPGESAGRTEEP